MRRAESATRIVAHSLPLLLRSFAPLCSDAAVTLALADRTLSLVMQSTVDEQVTTGALVTVSVSLGGGQMSVAHTRVDSDCERALVPMHRSPLLCSSHFSLSRVLVHVCVLSLARVLPPPALVCDLSCLQLLREFGHGRRMHSARAGRVYLEIR